MPALTLVVCIHKERDFLERLLRKAEGFYDDLMVVHDGPDTFGIKEVVERFHGRFFERPRAFQQEYHLPFAYEKASHDWILHFDADEFPGDELRDWLVRFRTETGPEGNISGYTCIWPLWNGRKEISKKYCGGRIFLFDRRQVKFFGMAEQPVIPDGIFKPLDLILHHQPRRKSYGMYNILMRKQAYRWRAVIASSLLGKPTDLPCWRWESETWPADWEQIRRHPLRTGLRRLVRGPFWRLRDQWRVEKRFFFEDALSGPVHHFLLCLKYWQVRRQHLRKMASEKKPADE